MLRGVNQYLRAISATESTGDLPALLRAASRAGRAALDADHCVVWFAGSPSHGPSYLVDGDGFLEVPHPPFGTDGPAVARHEDLDLPGLASAAPYALVAPLAGRTASGALALTRTTGFTADDEQAAAVVGRTLGMALDTTLLAAAERFAAATASRSALLERITALLQTSATSAEITARSPVAVKEVLDCLSASLYVLTGDELVGDGYPPHPAAAPDGYHRMHRTADHPVAEAVRTGSPVVLTRAEVPRFRDLRGVDPDCVGVTLVVPLAGRTEHALGALNVSWGERSPLETGDLELFAGVASQVGVALERAQLLDAERSSRRALARSHQALDTLARDLQRGLLPHRLPQRDGLQIATRYSPAMAGAEIGGDWYDAVECGDDVAVIIGDVEGHSTRAAGLMGQLRTAVRAYVSEGHDPSAALERTNRLLVDLDSELLATCCLVLLDTTTGVVSVATAGHPAPLVVDDAGFGEVAVEPGPPLGALHSARYPLTRRRLLGRSALVLHTDGVVEVLGEGSERGEQTLRETLVGTLREKPDQSAEQLASTIMAAIPHELTDDAAMLVATFTGARSGRLDASLWLPPDIRAVASAREFLRDRLTAWSTDELLDEAELVLSELVTNALVHTEGGAGLALHFDGAERRLTISVRDSSTRRPREREATPDALGGRGLAIVEAVADDWGVSVEPDGKTVWAALAVEVD